MEKSLGHKALKGTFWAAIDRFGMMGLQFVVNLVLARLLTPDDFGIIGVLSIFIFVSQTLIDGGFATALIQKKEPTQKDYSTIFYWNIALSVFLYAILFFCAPLIAEFFRMPILVEVLRAIGLFLIFSSLSIVQTTKMRKALQFKKLAIADMSALLIAGGLAIWAACCGWGVWSLVVFQVATGLFTSLILWMVNWWSPSLVFSLKSFRTLFSFGGYLLVSNLLQETCKHFQSIIIGRWFSATQMGYYTQAHKMDQVASYSLSQVIVQVMFPVYSAIQDDMERLRQTLAMNIRVISFVVFPILAILILVAEPLFVLLVGSKWLPAVPYFQILCVGGIFVCLQNVNFYAVAAKGASRLLFYWSFYKWGLLIALLFGGMNFGMTGIMWAMVASSFNIYLTNALLAKKVVGFSMKMQLGSMLPLFVIAAISFAISYTFQAFLNVPKLAGACIFLSLYVILAFACRLKVFQDVRQIRVLLQNKHSK